MRDGHPQNPAPLLVIVTGPPAAGKTAIANHLRHHLGLPVIAKDALKETLGDGLEFDGDRHASARLGMAAFRVQFAIVRELLESGVSLIVEGNFRLPEWFETLPPARVTQVHVSAAPETLRKRLVERDTHRHPVHYDREAADEIAARAAGGEWPPLALPGRLIEVDTTEWPDLDEVFATL